MLLQTIYPTCPLVSELEMATVREQPQIAIAPDSYPADRLSDNCDIWVKLVRPPSEYSFDEAKLLCQQSQDTWVAWVPDHGEIVLNRSDFSNFGVA